jgi:hypothetical protein
MRESLTFNKCCAPKGECMGAAQFNFNMMHRLLLLCCIIFAVEQGWQIKSNLTQGYIPPKLLLYIAFIIIMTIFTISIFKSLFYNILTFYLIFHFTDGVFLFIIQYFFHNFFPTTTWHSSAGGSMFMWGWLLPDTWPSRMG